MRFDIISIFPEMFDSYFGESIIKRAVQRRLLDIRVHNLRDWARGKHRQVDDKPFGGGPGMVMMVEPFHRALKQILRNNKKKTRVVLMSAKGKTFTHQEALRLAKYDRLVLLCGRYEGVDERVAKKLCDEELSIGNYVLTGGELPAMVVTDAVARHVPGVLGKAESLAEESHADDSGETEYPQYTRPEKYEHTKGRFWVVPKTLTGGDHKKIAAWRQAQRRSKK
jgi:tRNA (guanine37-N1)-methyltransferase